jgi:probable HAF family extracellular repeat protein
LLAGSTDSRVRTNSTRFVSSTALVANITISLDAVASRYDIAVTNASGKKGIGTELFTVLAVELLSGPAGASAANDVAGTGVIAGGRAGGCNSGRVPAFWRNGGPPVDLPLLAPSCNGTALYINESGEMVGTLDPSGAGVAVRWVPNAAAPTGYDVSAMNPPSDGTSAAFFLEGLNENSVAIGNRWHGSNTMPYWWQGGIWIAMPVTAQSGTTGCYVEDLNDVGEATGECWTGGVGSAAFWSSLSSSPILLPQLAGYTFASDAKALNNSGVVVGYAMKKTNSGGVSAGVRWTRRADGTWNSPEVLSAVDPQDINDNGVVVGSTIVSSKHHAFILVPGQPLKDLGSVGSESWAFAVTPSSAPLVLVTGVTTISNYKRGTLWRP